MRYRNRSCRVSTKRSPAASTIAAPILLPLSAAARPRLPGLLGKLYYFWVINVALADIQGELDAAKALAWGLVDAVEPR